MRARPFMLFACLAVWAGPVLAQVGREPHIGYVYPAGAKRGTTCELIVGGQLLRDPRQVIVSGQGVRAEIIRHYKPLTNIDQEQRVVLQRTMRELFEQRAAELAAKGETIPPFVREMFPAAKAGPATKPAPANTPGDQPAGKGKKQAESAPAGDAGLPEHPLLYRLNEASLKDLIHIRDELLKLRTRQRNPQIAESVIVRLTVEPGAALGDRDLRLLTPLGLTNPMRFEIGASPEALEQEPNEFQQRPFLPDEPPFELPVLVNGQVQPGDVDRFKFKAKKGQKLVIESQARRLVPYLADAVPGWFQATLALYDPSGTEVSFADDYRFNPDPVLFYEVPADGVYALEIRDAIYRGREDFVYRIAIGERPFITAMFPLGGKTGSRAVAALDGWNLPANQLPLATPPGGERIRESALKRKDQQSNTVTYAVDPLPESTESESSEQAATQPVQLPRMINGRIDAPGDVDTFSFQGRTGQVVVAEVCARRLGSPVDSVLRLLDAQGAVLAWNDDYDDKESGLLTHHADSYLQHTLPATGIYRVQVADTQGHGGEEYAYRLRIGQPRPDFSVRMSPSSLNVRPGGAAVICVYALRKDGYKGEITLELKNPPAGVTLSGGRIPPGCERICMTISAPPLAEPVALQLEAQGRIAGQPVRRPVTATDDMMQAFIYRHLVPAEQLMMASVGPRRAGPPVQVAGELPVKLPVGGTAAVQVRGPRGANLAALQFALREPPKGVTLDRTAPTREGLVITLKADREQIKPGFADNLIIEIFNQSGGRQGPGKGAKGERTSVGVLPAVPVEITNP